MSQAKVIKGLMLNGRTGRVIVYTDGIDQHVNFADASKAAQDAIQECLGKLQVIVNAGNLYRPAKSGAQEMIANGEAIKALAWQDELMEVTMQKDLSGYGEDQS